MKQQPPAVAMSGEPNTTSRTAEVADGCSCIEPRCLARGQPNSICLGGAPCEALVAHGRGGRNTPDESDDLRACDR